MTSPFLNSSSPGSEGTKSNRALTRDTVAAVVPDGTGWIGAACCWAAGPAAAGPPALDCPAEASTGFLFRSSSCKLNLSAICSSSSSF
ncbi:hypothetical protein MFIFM68171_06210 [Madurella fahalii]|uniref:Uncharacterized protein n=1 Tax=Madurella fahalii TaxID=1157608 RepID=A0ABQ0GE90_9PEZI